jgi:hypothetical protein
MIERGIFERVEEEDETQVAGPSGEGTASTSKSVDQAVHVPQPTIPEEKEMTSAASINSGVSAEPTHAPSPLFGSSGSNESKQMASPTSPGNWLTNRLKGTMTAKPTRVIPPSPALPSLGKTSIFSSTSSRRTDSPASERQISSSDGLALSRSSSASSTPVINITAAPSTTPTATSALRLAGTSEKVPSKTTDTKEEGSSTLRARQNPLTASASNRNVAVYAPQGPGYAASSSSHDDPMAMYSARDHRYNPSSLPYLAQPDPYTLPEQHAGTIPSGKAKMAQASTSNAPQFPPQFVDDPARHSREMSSSSTSGSDVDVSRYNFPDAPPHKPRTMQPEYNVANLRMAGTPAENQAMMSRSGDNSGERTPTYNKHPSRAPVHPGAYQAALRAAIEEIPDGPPPLYQPRASRRLYNESIPEQDYSDPPTPTSYSPYRVASPMRVPSRSTMDSNNSASRPTPSSPLSEVYTPSGSSFSDRGYGENRNEKAAYGSSRSRRPSDPYQRILAAAARGPPPGHNSLPRRGSSSQMSAQTLSPTPTGNTPSLISDQQSDYAADASSSDQRSRPTSQAFSTYTRATSQSTWGASQATATAIDHHDTDFPPDNGHEDDSSYYASMLSDLDGYEQERSRTMKEALPAKGVRSTPAGKEPIRQMPSPQNLSPPMPQIPRHLLEKQKIHLSDFPLPPTRRELPTPPLLQQYGSSPSSTQRTLPAMKSLPTKSLPSPPKEAPPPVPHSVFPGGMGWDELNRPIPRKLSKMEKALLRRVEFGTVAAADIASIPLA